MLVFASNILVFHCRVQGKLHGEMYVKNIYCFFLLFTISFYIFVVV